MDRIHKKSALPDAADLLIDANKLGTQLLWERYEQQLPLCGFTSLTSPPAPWLPLLRAAHCPPPIARPRLTTDPSSSPPSPRSVVPPLPRQSSMWK